MNGSLRDVFADLATDVRVVDLAPRVAHGVRRHRQRRAGVVAVTALALVAAAAAGVTRYRAVEPTGARNVYDVVWVDDQVAHPQVAIFAAAAGDDTGTEQHRHERVDRIDVSPDGRRIAYVVDQRVEVAELDGKRKTLDVTLPPGDAMPEVSWAPDSRRLAVSDIGDFGTARGFHVVDTRTGEARFVEHPHLNIGITWSPDGATVAVTRPAAGEGGGRPGGVDLVALDGGPVRSLGAADGWFLSSSHAWSPDGTRLVVLEQSAETTDALVVDVAAGTVLSRMEPGRYVWRSAERLAVGRRGGVFETTVGGREVATLYPFDIVGEPIRLAIRAAS